MYLLHVLSKSVMVEEEKEKEADLSLKSNNPTPKGWKQTMPSSQIKTSLKNRTPQPTHYVNPDGSLPNCEVSVHRQTGL